MQFSIGRPPWGNYEALSERALMTRAWPSHGPPCLRPINMDDNVFPGEIQRYGKAFF